MNPANIEFLKANPDMSSAEAAAVFTNDQSTVQKIDRKELAAYMLSRDLTTRMRVAMSQIPDNAPLPQLQLKLGMQKVLDLIFSGIDYVDTTKPEIAGEVSLLLEGMTQARILTEPQKAEMYALSGGRKFSPATATEVDTERLRIANIEIARDKATRVDNGAMTIKEMLFRYDGSAEVPSDDSIIEQMRKALGVVDA